MSHTFIHAFCKSTVAVIVIEIIIVMKIVADINIRQSVPVNIAYRQTQTVTERTVVYTGFRGNILEASAEIFVQNIARQVIFIGSEFYVSVTARRMNGMLH